MKEEKKNKRTTRGGKPRSERKETRRNRESKTGTKSAYPSMIQKNRLSQRR